MAPPGITAKIEELQFRIKTDPKSRLFFPLAEELRKNGKLPEAEQVLRTGLGVHPTYLSAWVSLGRVLREQHKNAEAVEALTTALQVDPGNVVAARLLGDSYLDLGEKVEAIKKYKLVHALMPGDEELEARIELLDRELRPAPEPEATGVGSRESGVEETLRLPTPDPRLPNQLESPFDETSPIRHTVETPFDTGDEIPMAAQHAESPFEEPSGYTADALEIEHPEGMHIEEAPLAAEVPAVWTEEPPESELAAEVPTVWAEEPRESEPAADVFAPAEPEPSASDDDLTATTTMADLYARQGLIQDARKIYEHMLERDPGNDELRAKLSALDTQVAGLPGDQVAETSFFDSATEQPSNSATDTPATWQLDNPATQSSATEQPSNPATEPPATWQLGNPVTQSATEPATWPPGNLATESHEPQPGNPATLHSHAKVVVLEQWLAKVAKRESHGA